LRSRSSQPAAFTALWKAFEEKVSTLTGIADLVQLCGYYQYAPKFFAQLNLSASVSVKPYWKALQLVVSGVGVAQQLPDAHLAALVGIPSAEVFPFCEHLRRIGYEVRNSNTNPQIAAGTFLIPYAFPTLTPRSVQLRKKLRG
jgi:DNA (cytosine-5)-methyltransferase 1